MVIIASDVSLLIMQIWLVELFLCFLGTIEESVLSHVEYNFLFSLVPLVHEKYNVHVRICYTLWT